MSISPEFMKSTGRKMVKSNFSQTCDLLSQYMKEKRNFGSNSTPESGKPDAMNLFPQHAGFGTSISTQVEQKKSTQMTIIYEGRVLVFDDISDEKVKELMMLASNGSLKKKKKTPLNLDLNCVQEEEEPILSSLPIARNASLHRFLAKRKDRMNARAPYQVSISAAETKSRLGLISQPSFELRL